MTAEELRELGSTKVTAYPRFRSFYIDGPSAQFLILAEIAAQLAEMNGSMAQISEELQTIRNKIG